MTTATRDSCSDEPGAGARSGAYGLAITGIADPGWLTAAPGSWALWQLTVERGERPPGFAESLGPDSAELVSEPRGLVRLSRDEGRAVLRFPEPLVSAGVAHPYLSSLAVVTSWWAGGVSFHAGSFVLDGGVWGVLGDRERGKSTLLAWLARAGVGVFSDDIVVLEGGRALAGPRCLDLRESAAREFGIGEDLGVVGTRQRWRVPLDPVPPELPFRGWVSLEWTDEITLTTVPASRRLAVLAECRGLRVPQVGGVPWLDALAKPMIAFGRPHDWAEADRAALGLLDRLSSL
ncbi:MAG TPA: hypothetical protein VND23_06025 [Acidimicrobiales bacterium]|nr:hypothetical protein [Acidimicrobiales bacterium]